MPAKNNTFSLLKELLLRTEKLWRWLNLLLILVTLISYLSPFIDPSSFWLFSLLGLGYPWLLLLNMLFVLFWVVLKKRYFLFSIACILVGWNHFQSFVGLNNRLSKSKGDISIMTFNSMSYSRLKGQTKKDFLKMVQKHQPDIIAMQEGYSRHRPVDKKDYPYIYQPKSKKLLVFSKYPFEKKENMDIGNYSNGCLFVDVKIKGKKLRLYNVHLQSNAVTKDASKLQKEGDLQEKETWLGIKDMLVKVKKATGIRSKQSKKILQHIDKSPYPVIVCADMNDTPLSFTYHLFSKKLKDGFKERAMGIGTTYDGNIPLLRLDYIWTDPSIQVKSHQIIKENFSDHYPVISTIRLN
jgi:endonuclease/exonuclease/phosphatase family metal-dependent hydrolase